jgi:Lectin C-type domain/Galactose oxidase, central domain/Kelch motif
MAMSLVKVVAGLRVAVAVGALVAGVAAQGAGPSARYAHSMAYDSARDRVVLFGGNNGNGWPNGALGDTWEWDGSKWLQRFPLVTPSPRGHGAMAYDTQRRVCVFFGGYFNAQPGIGETWEWDGDAWMLRTPQLSPAARHFPGMTYSSSLGKVVMFGGHNGTGNYNDTWTWDGTNWQQISTTNSPTARRYHGLTNDSTRNEVVLFGGYDNNTLGDTWTFDGIDWTRRLPATSPPARHHPGMCFQTATNRVLMFGGWTGANAGDTWEWDGANWTQRSLSLNPPARHWGETGHVYDSLRNRSVLFGGVTGAPLGDTWHFDGTNWSPAVSYTRSPVNGHLYGVTPPMPWQQAEALAVREGGHLATIRSAAENAWIQQTLSRNNLWIGLHLVNGQWVWTSGEPAIYFNWNPGEPSAGSETLGHLITAWGGRWNNSVDGPSQALIELDGGESAPLTSLSLSATAPPPATSFHTLAPTPTGSALLFGGNTANLPQPFTYTLTGTSWSKEFSILNPMARTDATLLLDPARSNNVLFGGRNAAGTALGDTWTWAAGQWTYLTPATAPAPRHGHRMAFDRVANVGLLFGGKDATGAELSDFWSWNGTTWAQLTPATLPPARANHGMAYDDLRNRTIVFGGKAGTARLSDVWEWDGTAWTNLTPQGTPAWGPDARDGHAMAYDPRAERVVFHGGETASGCQQDVWSWNGTEWTIHLAQSGSVPSARTGSQLIHDNGTNRMLLFAGGCGTSYTNDLWQLSLPTFARATSYGSPCIGSRGPLTLSVINDSLPIIGQTFQLEMSNVPTFSPCAGLLGFSNTSLNGVPLPFDLAFLSMPGCNAYMSKDLNFPLPAPNNVLNTTAWNLAIPLDPIFLSLHIYLQGLALEFGGARFATVTNGVDARIGDR